MIAKTKDACPAVLRENSAERHNAYIADPSSDSKKTRYRHPDIKTAIRNETSDKCVYCEAKVGHNTPGDIEHILPSSKRPELRFDWSNLTLACTECNRRKSDYYEEDCMFLNPYEEEVEDQLLHMGPVVIWLPGNPRAEVTVKKLELNTAARIELISQKVERLCAVDNLLERIRSEANPVLGAVLKKELELIQSNEAEYSQMVKAWVDRNVN